MSTGGERCDANECSRRAERVAGPHLDKGRDLLSCRSGGRIRQMVALVPRLRSLQDLAFAIHLDPPRIARLEAASLVA